MTDSAEVARGIVPEGRVGRALHAACRIAGFGGGAVLVSLILLTVTSIVLRELTGRPIPGDFELVEIGCAVAMFAFLPYCQLVGGNVMVEFVTARAPARLRGSLDTLSNLAYTVIAALLTWRLALGGRDIFDYSETTMVLGVPVWWAFVPIVPSVALLSATCAYTTWRSVRRVVR